MLYRYILILSEGIPEAEAANYVGYALPSPNPDATSADPLFTRAVFCLHITIPIMHQ